MSLSEMETRLVRSAEGRRRALTEDLRLMVAAPTGGGNSGALDELRFQITRRLGKLGAKVELVPGDGKPAWLHGVKQGGKVPVTAVCRKTCLSKATGMPPRPVLLSGHLDTVHDPGGSFKELVIEAGGKRATGPGCVDMKGGLVIMLAALEALDECGVDVEWTVVLNSDEETGSYHSESALRREGMRVAAAGGAGLVFEPALPDGSLVIERLGSGQFMVEARGRAAHVGRDFEKGVSAVTALAGAIVAVGQLPDVSRGKIASIGPAEGGTATNVVPDRARCWGNVRYPTREIADELEAGLRRLETAGEGLPRVSVETSFNRPAKPATLQVLRLAEVARGVAQELGQQMGFGKTGGVCDGNILQDAGLPTIDTLGARGGGLHTTEEWIELASLVERAQLAAVLIARIAEGRV
jgi:glutamate carboxypeptidase